jgi:hypothetical protein
MARYRCTASPPPLAVLLLLIICSFPCLLLFLLLLTLVRCSMMEGSFAQFTRLSSTLLYLTPQLLI